MNNRLFFKSALFFLCVFRNSMGMEENTSENNESSNDKQVVYHNLYHQNQPQHKPTFNSQNNMAMEEPTDQLVAHPNQPQHKPTFNSQALTIFRLPPNTPLYCNEKPINEKAKKKFIHALNALSYYEFKNLDTSEQAITQTFKWGCDLDPLVDPFKELIEPEIHDEIIENPNKHAELIQRIITKNKAAILSQESFKEAFQAQQPFFKQHAKKCMFGAAVFGFLMHPFVMPALKSGFSAVLHNCAQRLHLLLAGVTNQS